MAFLRKNLTALLLLLATGMCAQVQVRITLKDNDIITGTVTLPKINLATDYGKLDIPSKNVSGIRMGVKPDDEDNSKPMDIVEIDNTYSIAGQTNIKTLDVKTDYGTLVIPSDRIERMEVYMITEGQATFKLIASKHISSNTSGGWLNTGILLKKGETFSITANGQLVLASLSGAKYTPDGKIAGATDGSAYDYGSGNIEGGMDTYPNYGNVVYKIGEQGTLLKAGDKFTGTANTSGLLLLSIYEAVYNPQNTGSYIVKVERK